MKLEDLATLLLTLKVTGKNEEGKTDCTEEYKALCKELIGLTMGPSTLYEEVPNQATAAIMSVIPDLDPEQAAKVRTVVVNSIHVVIGTLIHGGVMEVREPDSINALKETLKKAIGKALGGSCEVNFENFGREEMEDEGENEFEPTPKKKEVVH